jgi:hypothetical protein
VSDAPTQAARLLRLACHYEQHPSLTPLLISVADGLSCIGDEVSDGPTLLEWARSMSNSIGQVKNYDEDGETLVAICGGIEGESEVVWGSCPGLVDYCEVDVADGRVPLPIDVLAEYVDYVRTVMPRPMIDVELPECDVAGDR